MSRKKRLHPHLSYRDRADALAHAAEAEPEPVPRHPLVCRGKVEMITSPDALADFIEHLRSCGSFGYDSEFIGEMSYQPKVCLIQAATTRRVALIDPLGGLDVTPFWEILADPGVEKIVHAGQQDLEPVVRYLGRAPASVFDVQIAAGFAGLAYPASLRRLVEELTGTRLGKGFTFTHWDRRPLSPMQQRYAADDVRYLPAVRCELARRLEASGHAAWAAEECAALCDMSVYKRSPADECLRMRGAGRLSPRQLAILRELSIWRDEAARRADLPARTYVRDEVLTTLAKLAPASEEQLARIHGLPRPVRAGEGRNILAAIERGRQAAPVDAALCAESEESPQQRFAIDALWTAVQARCYAEGIDPALVCSRRDVARFYRRCRGEKLPDNSDDPLARGWRGALLGDELRRFVEGSATLSLKWAGGRLAAQ